MSLIDNWSAEDAVFEECRTARANRLKREWRTVDVVEQVLRNHEIKDKHVCGPKATLMTVRQLAENIVTSLPEKVSAPVPSAEREELARSLPEPQRSTQTKTSEKHPLDWALRDILNIAAKLGQIGNG